MVFIIKNYNGISLKNYIMPQFHEEINGIDGINDDNFSNNDNLYVYFIEKYNKIPDAIIFLWDYSDDIYDKIRNQLINTKIIIWADDLHYFNIERYKKMLKCYSNCDYILSHYNRYKEFYDLEIENKILHFGNSCSDLFIREKINEDSENKIYMYGAVNEHYKSRVFFKNKMLNDFNDKFYFKNHPGYDGDQSKITLSTVKEMYNYTFCYTAGVFPVCNLPEELNKYKKNIELYGSGILGKFYEISGSGLLLLCDNKGLKDELEKQGFKNMINYIHIDENNFDEIINFIFNDDNKEIIKNIRKNGFELVNNNHLIKHRMKLINDFLYDKLLN